MTRQLFINLPVKDPKRSLEFFTRLGFAFNAKFTDDKAVCMIVNEATSVMLLGEAFFKTFTTKLPCDTKTHTECLLTVSCPNRAAVDQMVKLAVAAGGSQAGEAQDHGFMYDWSFHDLDGHNWGVMWMDPAAAQ